jgi:hypothetical protein
MPKLLSNSLILVFSLLLGVVLVELLSRLVLPVSPGAQNLTIDGLPLKTISGNSMRYHANLEFRQVSEEFDSRATIDLYGNRSVGGVTDNPEVIFLGDSFTFGHGLRDGETFSEIYCKKTNTSCANLGRNGSGTFVQLNILQHYLDTENWRPREVKLFVLAMTSTLMNGNDLLDNYYFTKVRDARSKATTESGANNAAASVKAPPNTNRWLQIRQKALQHSNLIRAIYFQIAPLLRARFSPKPGQKTLETALASTREAFAQLSEISTRYGFKYKIYLLHPVQDLIRNSWQETARLVTQVAPGTVIIDTANVFTPDPQSYYFSYDGHFNAKGAGVLAKFLLSER